MPGNSPRRGRRTTPKKGRTIGSGGKNRKSLEGRGRTPPAEERPWHKAYSGDGEVPKRTAWKQEKERRAAAAEGRAPKVGRPGPRVAPGRKGAPAKDAPELLVGRNPVIEALRAHVPATALYVAHGVEVDDRITEMLRTAGDRGIAILEVSRSELDRMTGGVLHQGIGLQVPPYSYEPFEDLLAAASGGHDRHRVADQCGRSRPGEGLPGDEPDPRRAVMPGTGVRRRRPRRRR